ncbi:MAG: glucose-1-phosphate adenylyltransferase [Polyangiaceae bacterium]
MDPLAFDPSQVLVMILAGGEGKRLHPLTLDRAKPAVPFGGRYRIIDIVLSNFVNSGIAKVKILTQYKSASLDEHIARVWRLSPILDQFIEAVPAQQRTGKTWYRGSADAVYQCKHVIEDEKPELVAIFGGDHIYKMDVRQMISFHVAKSAEATVAVIPIPRSQASDFGVIEINAEGKILAFHEKVANPPTMPGNPDMCLASMGNYIFQAAALMHGVDEDSKVDESDHDFGKNILPRMVQDGREVWAYDFATNRVPGEDARGNGYWRDVGTIYAYWRAQMDLIEIHPQFNLYNRRWPIRTGATHDPPAKFVFRDEAQARVGIATDSLVSHGCIISGGRIHRSVLSVGCRINSFSEVEESVLFEGVQIGRHTKLRRCIVDKDVIIPSGVEIGFNLELDRQRFTVDNGIVVIPKKAIIDGKIES